MKSILTDGVQMTMKKLFFTLVMGVCLISFQADAAKPNNWFSLKRLSYTWMLVTNPAESLTHFFGKNQTAVEEQHVVPQYIGGTPLANDANELTVYWMRSNHSISDRNENKPFLDPRENSWLRSNFILSILTLGNDRTQESLDVAYKMGAYGRPYSILFHDYHKDRSRAVSRNLDAPSMLLYGVSWFVNIPQKFVNHLAYVLKKGSEPNILYLADVVVSVPVYVVDSVFGIIFTVIGVINGFVCHPISSVTSLLGMVYYIIPTLWTAVSEFVLGVIRLATFWY